MTVHTINSKDEWRIGTFANEVCSKLHLVIIMHTFRSTIGRYVCGLSSVRHFPFVIAQLQTTVKMLQYHAVLVRSGSRMESLPVPPGQRPMEWRMGQGGCVGSSDNYRGLL
jgi:hypothetical protein